MPIDSTHESVLSVDVMPDMLQRPTTVCIPNIGPRERRRRLVFGILALGLSAVLLTMLLVLGADRWLRLGLFGPLWGAALGVIQATEKT